LIAYLQRSSAIDSAQERETLDRMWARIAGSAPGAGQQYPWKGTIISMQERQTLRSNVPAQKQGRSRGQRLSILAAVLVLVALVGSMVFVFNALRHPTPAGPTNVGGKPPVAATQSTAPFRVTGVDMQVSPSSIAGMTCGSNLTVKYTATFHIAPHSAGGTVQFAYTVNNGRSQQPASLVVGPGETTKSYTFTWQGALPADHTYPGPGGVQVTSPNHLISQLVGPSGACTAATAFKILSVSLTVSPASIAGRQCGTSLVVTYTATFHAPANSTGGTVHFEYTINNGRGSAMASLTFKPGETTKTYAFTWSGTLPADHTYPEAGGVIVTSPNTVNSPLVGPTGQCS
jgi:hypothetical protein